MASATMPSASTGTGTTVAPVFIATPEHDLIPRVLDGTGDVAAAAGAKVVCDNTFLSPALQNPIKLGADFVVHSTTKFINGHSDVVGGAVVVEDEHQTISSAFRWRASFATTPEPGPDYCLIHNEGSRGPYALRLATDRPHVVKFYGAYNMPSGTQVGAFVYAGSGTPMTAPRQSASVTTGSCR